jgi:hypothetical protein
MNYKNFTVELYPCGDCAALPGYPHSDMCDVARCPLCGIQRIQCYDHARSTTLSIWTGIWPGYLECIEYDLWTKWADEDGNKVEFEFGSDATWYKTTADDPDRTPDLNALAVMPLKWSRKLQRFVKHDYAGVA